MAESFEGWAILCPWNGLSPSVFATKHAAIADWVTGWDSEAYEEAKSLSPFEHKLTAVQSRVWRRLYRQGVRCVRAKTVTTQEQTHDPR